MAIFRQRGRENNAKVFLNDFNNSKDHSYFISIGNSVTSPVADVNVSYDNIQADQYVWDNMFLMKQVFRSDVSLMIRRIDWVANTRYEAFDITKNQYEINEPFYAYNQDNNSLYVCLSSPDNVNALSQYAPTSQSIEPEVKSDNYIWKFLCKVDELDLEKFDYPGYLPVKQVGTDLYNDDRVLQQNVQANSIKGAIEGIDIIVQGGEYSNVDVVNNNFASNYYYASSITGYFNPATAGLYSPYDVIVLDIENAGITVSAVENYYDGTHIIRFESGYTALITSSSLELNETTGRITNLTLIVCNLYPEKYYRPSITEKYSILPYVKIVGNGTGAVGVPVFSSEYLITKVLMLTGGSGYSYAEAAISIQTTTTLKPVLGLNGLTYDITELLGAKHVMISKKIKPISNLSAQDPVIYSAPENIGVVYNGNEYKDIVTENTYYTQFALIKDPRIIVDDKEVIAGTSVSEIREMVVEAIDPTITITIGTSNATYLNSTGFFEIGDVIVRGPEGVPDQFRAVITNIGNTTYSTILTCDLVNGAFETYSGYRIKNLKNTTEIEDDEYLVFLDCESNCSKSISVVYQNTFSASDFKNDDFMSGLTSFKNAEIYPPTGEYSFVNPLYPTKAKIRVKDPSTGFIQGRYVNGEYIPGEIVTSVKTVDGQPQVKSKGKLVSIGDPLQIINDETLGYSYILECGIDRTGIDTLYELVNTSNVSLETNTLIRQTSSAAVGKLIRIGIQAETDATGTVYLYVNNYNRAFTVDANRDASIVSIDNLYNPTTSNFMGLYVKSIVYAPKLVKYSGNLLYINDAGPIQRRLENSEIIKLLVEF